MEVTLFREDETPEHILHELMDGCDLAVPFDAADPKAQFRVDGWFVFQHGSLTKKHNVLKPA